MALVIARESEFGQDLDGIGSLIGDLAECQFLLSNFDGSKKLYEERLAIADSLRDKPAQRRTNGSLGNIYLATGQPKEAIKCYRQALSIATELDDHRAMALHYMSMSDAFIEDNEYDDVILSESLRSVYLHGSEPSLYSACGASDTTRLDTPSALSNDQSVSNANKPRLIQRGNDDDFFAMLEKMGNRLDDQRAEMPLPVTGRASTISAVSISSDRSPSTSKSRFSLLKRVKSSMITPKFTSTPLKKKSKIPFMRSTKSLKSLTKFGGNIDGSNLWPAIDEDVAEAEEEKPQQNKKTPLPPPRKSRLPPPPALLAEAIENKENSTTTGPSESNRNKFRKGGSPDSEEYEPRPSTSRVEPDSLDDYHLLYDEFVLGPRRIRPLPGGRRLGPSFTIKGPACIIEKGAPIAALQVSSPAPSTFGRRKRDVDSDGQIPEICTSSQLIVPLVVGEQQ
ncbi:unnamed protein product, partial [Mesorhabditis spiculigera]